MDVHAMPGPVPGTLPGPMGKDNKGAADCNSQGLLAYACGSSVAIVDVQTMQLVQTLAGDKQGDGYVTAVRWSPEGISRDLSQANYLWLAVGDHRGRIAIWDVVAGDVSSWLVVEGTPSRGEGSGSSRSGDGPRMQGPIQDLCWAMGKPWLLAAILGPSLIVLWEAHSSRLLWRLDLGPDAALACLKSDPFDSRQLVVAGLRGLLMNLTIGGMRESETVRVEHTIPSVPLEENKSAEKGEKGAKEERAAIAALLAGPAPVRCTFSDTCRGILYVMLPREIIAFDLQFGMQIATTALPRSYAKFVDIVAVVDGMVLHCLHGDGKLSSWQRKEDSQLFVMRNVGTLLPSVASPSPQPQVVAAVHSARQTISTRHLAGPLPAFAGGSPCTSPISVILGQDSAYDFPLSNNRVAIRSTLISITDDGRLWQWQARATIAAATEKAAPLSPSRSWGPSAHKGPAALTRSPTSPRSAAAQEFQGGEADRFRGEAGGSKPRGLSPIRQEGTTPGGTLVTKLELMGLLHTLSSQITTLATPIPPGSQSAGSALPAVPLVALAMQAGTIDLVDIAANAVSVSFAVHNSPVRAIRWLGNSKLVSFSYTEVKGKGGGFVNRLVVTCARSGQSKVFRIQKGPEKAPMRGLRTSPSGRYLLILFREAPAEVWAMTREPQLLRSLALPFTVMEWATPVRGAAIRLSRRPASSTDPQPSVAAAAAAASAPEPESVRTPDSHDEAGESFAFALVNGSLGVFELKGRRVRDFRPQWPVASFVNDILVTAMAFRMPLVAMGDRAGNLRWWDVITGSTGVFPTHRGGIRRVRFVPLEGRPDESPSSIPPGQVAVLFNDRSFGIYDLETQTAMPQALVDGSQANILAIEIDFAVPRPPSPPSYLPESPLLTLAAVDGSLRLLAVYPPSRMRAWNPTAHNQLVPSPPRPPPISEQFRPLALSTPAALLPPPQTQALRLLLQLGVRPSWLCLGRSTADSSGRRRRSSAGSDGAPGGSGSSTVEEATQPQQGHMLELGGLPVVGDSTVAEILLSTLEGHCRAGRLLDIDATLGYEAVATRGVAARCAFAAAHFGDVAEALFWATLPRALVLLSKGFAGPGAFWNDAPTGSRRHNASMGGGGTPRPGGTPRQNRPPNSPTKSPTSPTRFASSSASPRSTSGPVTAGDASAAGGPWPVPAEDRQAAQQRPEEGGVENMASGSAKVALLEISPEKKPRPISLREESLPTTAESSAINNNSACSTSVAAAAALVSSARERITWHERLSGHEAMQRRIHELVTVGDYEAAVSLLLTTPPDSPSFYIDAMRAITLASAVSPAMQELAIKVVAANLVVVNDPLSGTHILCAIGRYQEACTQLQDSGKWVDAATLAATHLTGIDRSRVLERWGDHVLRVERNLWWGASLLVAAGALGSVLSAMRAAKLPDAAAFFLLACHEAKADFSKAQRKGEEGAGVGVEVWESTDQVGESKGSKGEGSEDGGPVVEEGKVGGDVQEGGSAVEEVVGGGEDVVLGKGLRVKPGKPGAWAKIKPEVDEVMVKEEDVDQMGAGFSLLDLPGDLKDCEEEARGVCEYFGQYQRWLAHLCKGSNVVL